MRNTSLISSVFVCLFGRNVHGRLPLCALGSAWVFVLTCGPQHMSYKHIFFLLLMQKHSRVEGNETDVILLDVFFFTNKMFTPYSIYLTYLNVDAVCNTHSTHTYIHYNY